MNRFILFLGILSLGRFAQASEPYQIHRLSQRELLRMYEALLVDACHDSDRFWHEWPSDSRAGFWGSGRSDQMNEGIRAISEMVLTCAVIARYSETASVPEKQEYTRKAIAAIRYAVATHLSGVEKCTDGKPWGGSWQSALWTGTLGFGAWLLGDELDPALRKDVERVVASEADRFLDGKPPGGSFNDTKAEENGWNLTCISVAANMFPADPHAAAWNQKAMEYMINTLSAPQDRDDHNIVDGRPVSEWFSAENIHPDFTLENHGFYHPAYVGCSSYFLTQTGMHYTYAHRPVPQAATHHLMDVWRMFQSIILPCGESAYPQGMDWELHGLPFINLFASLATYQRDAVAARMESLQLQYMRAWQRMSHGDLAVPGSTLGFTRHAICAEQAAYGLLARKIFGPSVKELSAQKTARLLEGVRHYDYAQFITHRTRNKFVSFSWTNRVMGMVIPIGPDHESNPDFTVPIINGIVGSFELSPHGDTKIKPLGHEWKISPDGFETSGSLLLNGGRLEQKLHLVSIGDKAIVYEDRVMAVSNVTVMEERGIPLGIENDQITGGQRLLWDQEGRTIFDSEHPQSRLVISGSWANVDGRLGVVAIAGEGMAYLQAPRYSPGIAVRSDVLCGSFSGRRRDFKAGEQVAHRMAIIFLEVSPEKTVALARCARVEKTTAGSALHLKLPEGRHMQIPLRWTDLGPQR